MGILAVLWTNRKLIGYILLVIAASVLVYMAYRNVHYHYVELPEALDAANERYEKLYAEGQEATAHWKEQVKIREDELEAAQKHKEEILNKNQREFNNQKEELKNARTELQAAIMALKPTDTVSVPSKFVCEYNKAVRGSQLATGPEGVRVPESGPCSAGGTQTFKATTFYDVVLGNTLEYNDLALRCGKLQKIVKELEHEPNDSRP